MFGQGGWHGAGQPLQDVRRMAKAEVPRHVALRYLQYTYPSLKPQRVSDLLADVFGRTRSRHGRKCDRRMVGVRLLVTSAPLSPCRRARALPRPKVKQAKPTRPFRPQPHGGQEVMLRGKAVVLKPAVRSRANPSQRRSPPRDVSPARPTVTWRQGTAFEPSKPLGILLNPDADSQQRPRSMDPATPQEDGWVPGKAGGDLLPF